MNIGFRPTFEGGNQTLEVHVLDFQEQFMTGWSRLSSWSACGPKRSSGSVEELKRQIAADIGLARLILGDLESDESDSPDRSDLEV